MHLLRWLPIDLYHLRCAAIMISTGLSIPWCWPSMIYKVFLYNDSMTTIHGSLKIFGSVSRRQTWPSRDSLMVDSKSWRLARISICYHTYSFVLCSLCDMPRYSCLLFWRNVCRSTVRIYVCWQSCFSITRHSITTLNLFYSTSWPRPTNTDVTWSDTSQR